MNESRTVGFVVYQKIFVEKNFFSLIHEGKQKREIAHPLLLISILIHAILFFYRFEEEGWGGERRRDEDGTALEYQFLCEAVQA